MIRAVRGDAPGARGGAWRRAGPGRAGPGARGRGGSKSDVKRIYSLIQ